MQTVRKTADKHAVPGITTVNAAVQYQISYKFET
jgi:hypothetical protein